MASLKAQLKNKSQFPAIYHMTDWEWGYTKELNLALVSSIYHRRLMFGLFTYIVKTRLGLEPDEGYAFKFEIELNKDEQTLTTTQEKIKQEG